MRLLKTTIFLLCALGVSAPAAVNAESKYYIRRNVEKTKPAPTPTKPQAPDASKAQAEQFGTCTEKDQNALKKIDEMMDDFIDNRSGLTEAGSEKFFKKFADPENVRKIVQIRMRCANHVQN